MTPELARLLAERRDAEAALLEGLAIHLRLTQAIRATRLAADLPIREPFEDRAFIARAATLDDGTGRLTWLAQTIALLRTLDTEAPHG